MKHVKLLNTPQQPATAQELVDATLQIANGAEVEINGVRVPPPPAGFALPAEDLWGFNGSQDATAAPPSWDAVWTQTLADLRQDLRTRLDEVMTAPDAAAARAVRGWHWTRLQTVLRLAPEGLRLATHYPVTGVADLCDVGIALLLDVERGRRADLCKCQLSSCGRYFFVDRGAGNRPRTRYCSTAHMLAFHGGDRGAARVRKHRSKQRESGAPGRS